MFDKGKKKQESGTAVAPAESTALASPVMGAMMADAGQGLEGAGREDYAIPFLNVTQALSPIVQDETSDVKAGAIMDSVTGDVYPGHEGIEVVPVHYEKVINEWVPRDDGGGFIASYKTREAAQAGVEVGHDLVDTANHYVLYRGPDGVWRQAVLSCTSTKLRVSRQWNTRLSMLKVQGANGAFTPPTFGTIWQVTTVKQENKKGIFYNLDLGYVGLVEDETLYEEAKRFRSAIMEGDKGTDFSKMEGDVEEAEVLEDDGPGF